LDAEATAVATRATLGVLTEAGVLNMPAIGLAESGGPWRREGGPRTNHTGVLVPLVHPGDRLKRGTAIAEVRTIGGEVLETLRSRARGFVIALPERTHVVPGVASATIAVRER
jgi:predicted deacylase